MVDAGLDAACWQDASENHRVCLDPPDAVLAKRFAAQDVELIKPLKSFNNFMAAVKSVDDEGCARTIDVCSRSVSVPRSAVCPSNRRF